MSFLEYKEINDNTLEFNLKISKFISEQPTTNEECILITLSICAIIDNVKEKYSTHKQILIFDCLDSNIKQIKNIEYLFYMIREIHKYTKDLKLLQKLIIINHGESLLNFYNRFHSMLPTYINNLIEFRKNE
jgi:hypothetical protein